MSTSQRRLDDSRVMYRLRLRRPRRAGLAALVALAGWAALSGRTSAPPLIERMFGSAAGGYEMATGGPGKRGTRGMLSEELVRHLSKVDFDEEEEKEVSTGKRDPAERPAKKKTKKKQKKVAFLFLIRDSVAHQDLWMKWFESSSEGDWRDRANVYVHIKPSDDADRPRTTLPDLAPIFCDNVVPSVRSKWFFLHHAMMQLLLYSFIRRDNVHFVFVSDTSVPVKSFDEVYDELVHREGGRSRICHADPGEGREAWKPLSNDARIASSGLDVADVSKSSLWSSYSRRHVRYLLENAETLAEWYDGYMDAPSHRWGAADEMLLPTLLRTHVDEEELSDCHGYIGAGGPLPTPEKQSRALAAEEKESRRPDERPPPPTTRAALLPPSDSRRLCCPHAEKWGDRTVPRRGLAPLLDEYRCPPPGTPCEYRKLSRAELREIADMGSVLFLRKVSREATVTAEDGESTVPLGEALAELLGIADGSPKEQKRTRKKHFCNVNH